MFVAGIDAHATYSVIAIVSNTGQLVAGPIRILALDQHQLGSGQRVHRARTHRSRSVAGLLRTHYPRVVRRRTLRHFRHPRQHRKKPNLLTISWHHCVNHQVRCSSSSGVDAGLTSRADCQGDPQVNENEAHRQKGQPKGRPLRGFGAALKGMDSQHEDQLER